MIDAQAEYVCRTRKWCDQPLMRQGVLLTVNVRLVDVFKEVVIRAVLMTNVPLAVASVTHVSCRRLLQRQPFAAMVT